MIKRKESEKRNAGKTEIKIPPVRTFVSHLSTCAYRDKGSYLWGSEKTGFVAPQGSVFWSKGQS